VQPVQQASATWLPAENTIAAVAAEVEFLFPLNMIKYLTLLLLMLPVRLISQDTVALTDLTYENGLWCRMNTPYTGIATNAGSEMKEYYTYCSGKACGYLALYLNGDTAGVHTYSGNDIHLVFYTREKKKTLEYHQRILDQTYMVGEWMDFRDDGSLQVKGNYDLIKGELTGRGGITFKYESVKDSDWEFYDQQGSLIKTEIWRKGKLIRTKK
jgi:hypothetical protein